MRFHSFVFTGKEKDEETGYGYLPHQARQAHHGARYMDHELMTMWLSVDPLADKYPSISPYAYCAWNPVKLVDPDGREIYITGDAAEQATSQLSSKGITVGRDEKTGKLSYTKTGEELTASDKQLISAIESKDIIVNVYATTASTYSFEREPLNNNLTGQFLGVSLSDCRGLFKKRLATTMQLVNPDQCEARDKTCNVEIGTSMRHEVTESFQAGKICRREGISCGPCWSKWANWEIAPYDHVYFEAHGKATPEAITIRESRDKSKAERGAARRTALQNAGINIDLLKR